MVLINRKLHVYCRFEAAIHHALKANQKVAFSQTDQQQGRYQSIESLVFEAHQAPVVWLAKLDFPVLLTKQVRSGGPVQRRGHRTGDAPSGD